MKNKLLKLAALAFAALVLIASLNIVAFAAENTAATAQNTASKVENYGYSQLNEKEQYIYDCILSCVSADRLKESIDIDSQKQVTKAELEKVFTVFVCDNPQIFWINNGYGYSTSGDNVVRITPSYSFDTKDVPAAINQLNSAVNKILEGMPDTNDYEKALYLHDKLADAVSYEQVGHHQTAYGALVAGKSVCAGYAAAYQLLLKSAGIRAYTVNGSSIDPVSGQSIAHAWNLVFIGSECVYTDVTWDDQANSTYHYYFNLSKKEIDQDHSTSSPIPLPTCDHTDLSYFDKNDLTVTENTSVQDLANMFGSADAAGRRSAVIYYEGTVPFATLLNNRIEALYLALNGDPSSYSYSTSSFCKEIHLTIQGSFSTSYFNVNVQKSDNMIFSGPSEQRIAEGDHISPITVYAKEGYYFPENYPTLTENGITVRREDHSKLTVFGRPIDSAHLVLAPPSAMQKEEVPTAVFQATGSDSGTLSGLKAGMKYSINNGIWTQVNDDAIIELTHVNPGSILVYMPGNRTSTIDSEMQTITVNKAEKPRLEIEQPSNGAGGGCIFSNTAFQYSTNGKNWIPCSGELVSLEGGTYYVRTPFRDSTLASNAVTVVINCAHTSVRHYEKTEADCMTEGNEEYLTCNICHAILDAKNQNVLNAIPTIPRDNEAHSFSQVWTQDSSSHRHECKCGLSKDDAPHTFTEWEESYPEGSIAGEKTRNCTVCGYSEKQLVASKPNNGGGNVVISTGCSSTISGLAIIIASIGAGFFATKKKRG